MREYTCVREKTNDSDEVVILKEDDNTYKVGFGYEYNMSNNEVIDENNENFAKIDFVDYNTFDSYEKAFYSTQGIGFPFRKI